MRYDGIYRIARCWRTKGKQVRAALLRRHSAAIAHSSRVAAARRCVLLARQGQACAVWGGGRGVMLPLCRSPFCMAATTAE